MLGMKRAQHKQGSEDTDLTGVLRKKMFTAGWSLNGQITCCVPNISLKYTIGKEIICLKSNTQLMSCTPELTFNTMQTDTRTSNKSHRNHLNQSRRIKVASPAFMQTTLSSRRFSKGRIFLKFPTNYSTRNSEANFIRHLKREKSMLTCFIVITLLNLFV